MRFRSIDNNPYLFPGRRRGQHLINIHDAWDLIRKRAGLEDVRIYDLRHTYASIQSGNGESIVEIGALMGHRNLSTTRGYMHPLNDPLRGIG